MKKQTILIICLSDLQRDSRVYRQILALKNNYTILSAGLAPSGINDIQHIQLDLIRLTLKQKLLKAYYHFINHDYDLVYWRNLTHINAYNQLMSYEFDLILANDIDVLPLAVRIAQEKQIKLIYDAHEYTPREFENSWRWRILSQPQKTYFCQKYLPKIDAMLTVCDAIAQEYWDNFKVQAQIITNAPYYQDLEPSIVNPEKIRLIHHGIAVEARNLELMIEMMRLADQRFELNLMLVTIDENYMTKLRNLAHGMTNIKFLTPVAMPEIAKTIQQFDIGLFILPPNNFNYANALPNKFFEFIQARLMIAIGPSPEMANYVTKYDLGIVTSDFSAPTMANRLNQLSMEQIQAYKYNAHNVAAKLSFENNIKRLNNIVKQVLE